MKILKEKKYSILSNVLKYSFVAVIFMSLVMPIMFVGAENIAINAKIENPVPSITDLPMFIKALVNAVLIVGIPLLVLAVIYAGFLYVKAQGNPGELEVAHRTLLYTVIGGFLLLGAFVIAEAIGKTVDDIKSTT